MAMRINVAMLINKAVISTQYGLGELFDTA